MPSASPLPAWFDAGLASAAPVGGKRFRVLAEHLRLGMFVTDLDRPWADTPFLIQGFRVDSEIELSTLRRHCGHVFVDLDRSDPVLADAIRAGIGYDGPHCPSEPQSRPAAAPGQVVLPRLNARWPRPDRSPRLDADTEPVPQADDNAASMEPPGPGAAPAAGHHAMDRRPGGPDSVAASRAVAPGEMPAPMRQRAPRLRADVRISTDTRDRFRSFVRSMTPSEGPAVPSLARRALAGLARLIGRRDGAGQTGVPGLAAEQAVAEEVLRALPPESRLRAWPEQSGFDEEVSLAGSALAQAQAALEGATREVLDGHAPHSRPLADAVAALVESSIRNPDAIAWAARPRDDTPAGWLPGIRTALCMVALGRQLGLPRVQMIHFGMIGLLADIGKARLPRALLEKPGMLSPAEFSIVKEHVRLGVELLAQDMSFAPEVSLGIAQHHERLDGSGYPQGLRGGEISLYGRAAGIADSYAALVAARPYATPLAAQNALMNLYQWGASSFHAPLVEQFVQAIGVFPVGSLVELSDGAIAMVKSRERSNRLEPRVLVLTDSKRQPLHEPLDVPLAARAAVGADRRPLKIVRGLPEGSRPAPGAADVARQVRRRLAAGRSSESR